MKYKLTLVAIAAVIACWVPQIGHAQFAQPGMPYRMAPPQYGPQYGPQYLPPQYSPGVMPAGHATVTDGKGGKGGGKACEADCRCSLCVTNLRMWGSFEFLLGWGKGRDIPALVTTSPAGTPQADAGVLGEPGTEILFGAGEIGTRTGGGARVDFGWWMNQEETLGIGARLTGFRGDDSGFYQESTGNPILARPFFNVQGGAEASQLIAFTGLTEGNINAQTTNDILGTDAYLRANMFCGKGYVIDFIGGYQFNRWDDDVRVTTFNRITGNGLGLPIGSTIDAYDFFDAHNEFHGGMFGVVSDFHYRNFRLSFLAKLGVGHMNQRVSISGQSIVDDTVTVTVLDNGLLTQESNIGVYSDTKTAYIPELGITMGYSLEECVEFTLGYNFIWWSSLVMAGDAIDTRVDPTQVQAFPAFPGLIERDYFLHSVSAGVNLYW